MVSLPVLVTKSIEHMQPEPSKQKKLDPNSLTVIKTNNKNFVAINKCMQMINYCLHQLTDMKYSAFIRPLTISLQFRPLRELLSLFGKLEYLNNLPDDNILKVLWKKRFVTLLNSANSIKDLDAHPLGLQISIAFQAEVMQKALNVKRLSTNTKDSNGCRELPVLDRTNLYEHKTLAWVRISTTNFNQVLKKIQEAPSLQYVKFFSFGTKVYELYFAKMSCYSILKFMSECKNVRVIFYNNCRSFQAVCNDPLLAISNTLAFYYCNSTSHIEPVILNMKNFQEFSHYYVLAVLFYLKLNLMTANNVNTATPLSVLTGSNPRLYIQKMNLMEDMSVYDHQCLKDKKDLRNTPMTAETIAKGERYKLWELKNDRDSRLVTGSSMMGGKSMHELVVQPIDGSFLMQSLYHQSEDLGCLDDDSNTRSTGDWSTKADSSEDSNADSSEDSSTDESSADDSVTEDSDDSDD